jgi:hypothetical protein
MAYERSTYNGDDIYSLNCTGDAVVGDEVRFERATFSGSYRRPRFDGFEMVTGKIVNDSYGAEKQQHTFTIQLENGSKMLIKGRNLYKNGVYRKPWADESEREESLEDKHERGSNARAMREARLVGAFY